MQHKDEWCYALNDLDWTAPFDALDHIEGCGLVRVRN
jgi:hypothetical protein